MLRSVSIIWLMAYSFASVASTDVSVKAIRIWPSNDYTRITIETEQPSSYEMQTAANPERLTLTLKNTQINNELKKLPNLVRSDDPYVRRISVSAPTISTVQIAIDLKTGVKPTVFTLLPLGKYDHRLVLDMYPVKDPLEALLDSLDQAGSKGESLPQNDKKDSVGSHPSSEPVVASKEPELSKRVLKIAIDAGHGGEDPGALGAKGTHEKDVVLAIAKKLATIVNQEPGMEAILIRDNDYFIPLARRVFKARKLQADLFISIHADASPSVTARGSSVFALSERGATSVMAKYLANKENQSDLIGGGANIDVKDHYLAKTLFDLSQAATIRESVKLGMAVLRQLDVVNHLHKQHVEQAGFAVLKSPEMPSILVETAFISNPLEEALLNNEGHQSKIAHAVLTGVRNYFNSILSLR